MPSHFSFVPHLMGQFCVTLCSLHFDRLCDLCASHFNHSWTYEQMCGSWIQQPKNNVSSHTQWNGIKFGFNFATFTLTIILCLTIPTLPLLIWVIFDQMPWLIIVETFNHLSHITFWFLVILKFLLLWCMLFHLHFFSFEAATSLGVVTFGMLTWAYSAFVNHKIIPQTFHQLHHSWNLTNFKHIAPLEN